MTTTLIQQSCEDCSRFMGAFPEGEVPRYCESCVVQPAAYLQRVDEDGNQVTPRRQAPTDRRERNLTTEPAYRFEDPDPEDDEEEQPEDVQRCPGCGSDSFRGEAPGTSYYNVYNDDGGGSAYTEYDYSEPEGNITIACTGCGDDVTNSIQWTT